MDDVLGNRFSPSEIAKAAGMTRQGVQYRANRLGLHTRGGGFTYDEVKAIVGYKTQDKRLSRPRAVNDLKLRLKNDGLKYSK